MALSGPDPPLPPAAAPAQFDDEALLDSVARRVVGMGLGTPAVFFLESSKPLTYVGSQALVFLEPFVKSFLDVPHYGRFVALMEDRQNVERLLTRIEALDEEALDAERRRKAEAKAQAREQSGAGSRPFLTRIWDRMRGR